MVHRTTDRITKRHSFMLFAAVYVFSSISTNVSADELSQGDSDKVRLPRVLVTANRYETEADKVGSSFTIIDGEQIEAYKQPSLVEMLRIVPGVSVVQSGGSGKVSSVFLRGGESDHTLVLIDGVRVNSNSLGSFDFADIRAENIERIEIIRGPQSVLYGSEAIGGVINVITRKGTEGVSARARLEGGSFGTFQTLVDLSGGEESTDYSLSASYTETDGISAANKDRGNSEEDGYDNLTFSTHVGLDFLDDSSIGSAGRTDLSFRYTHGNTELDNFGFDGGAVDDLNAEQKHDLYVISLNTRAPLAPWLEAGLELGYSADQLEGNDPDTEFNNFNVDSDVFSTTLQFDLKPFEGDVATFGYDFELRSAENVGNFNEEASVNSFYFQNQWTPGDTTTLTLGVRNDRHADFGDETTYRATISQAIRQTVTRIHASFGTGFRAPAFNELFFPGFGNSDLNAETSLGYDIGLEQSFLARKVVLDVTFFKNSFNDLIGFSTETFTAINVDEANAYGFETALEMALAKFLKLNLSATFTESEDETTGRLLARRPRRNGSATLRVGPLGGLSGALTFLFVADRIDSTGEAMDDYERVDLALAYELQENIAPYLRIENLLDEDYEDVTGFGTPGFSAFGGVNLLW